MIFDKAKIKSNFNRANLSYNSKAVLQKIVAENLVTLAKDDISKANDIIDFGSGTGFVAQNILKEFPDKKIFQLDISEKMLNENFLSTNKIVADIESLPFADKALDLGISSLTLQWVNDLEKTIKSILKTIKNENGFYFSIIGSETLKELKESAEKCQLTLSINDFPGEEKLTKIFNNLNLKFQITSEIIILDYKDCYELLHSIKSIGASYNKNRNFMNKTQFEALNNFYLKNFNSKGRILATWQIFYVSI